MIRAVPFTDGLLFHELVHVQQYRQLGIPRFSEFYVRGFLSGGGYDVRTVATAGRMACIPDYLRLRPVLLEMKARYAEGLGKFKESPKFRGADSECLAYHIASRRSST